jgi:putative peptide zinc metalloprotease protein
VVVAALMSGPLFSSSWYRVAELKPRLRSHARLHRHRYRGRSWFVLQDLSTGAMHRFRPEAHEIVGRLDGEQSVDAIWRLASERLGDDAPTQDDVIRLLAQLHAADLLQSEIAPDTAELLRRYEQQQRSSRFARWMNPFAVQIPLVDPDRMLSRSVRYVRPLIGRAGLLLWLALVLPAAALAALNFQTLSEGVLDRIFTPANLLAVWLLFPCVKALHELGHAYTTRAYGGEVHEMGLMLLVLSPVPYVDASAATAFPSKAQRMAVGAAGMIVELALAALAMLLWAAVEPGVVRTLTFNVMLICGVTTLGFNANPLLRFDGYYVLADWLEIPNLRQRSGAMISFLFQRHLLGHEEARPPDATARERAWLAAYAVGSFAYRLIVTFAIALFVLELSLPLGALMLGAAVLGWFAVPLVRGARRLLQDPQLREARPRMLTRLALAGAMLVLVTLLLPLPLRTRAEGVVWIPEEAHVRALEEGFVAEVLARPGARVERGDALVRLRDPVLETAAAVLQARVEGLEWSYAQERHGDRVRAQIVHEQLLAARDELADARGRLGELRVTAGASGTFVCPGAQHLPGRFVRKGDEIAQVVDLGTLRVRAVVGQDDIDLVRRRLRAVSARLAERVGEVVPAALVRVVPGASGQLPSSALGSAGGGAVVVDPRDREGLSSVERIFQLELELPSESGVVNVGGRVHLRFEHGLEPLAWQAYRRLRQLFLSRLDV